MKVSEAMAYADRLTGEPVESDVKLMWLNRLEKVLFNDIYSQYENPPKNAALLTGADCDLSVEEPYSNIYPLYISLCCSLERQETEVYANKASAYMSAFSSFADYYNRTHMPKSANISVI